MSATIRVLLDTNILIHREARTVVRDDIGTLFRWLDRLNYEKCVHSGSVIEIQKHSDPSVVHTLGIKLGSYNLLSTRAPDSPAIAAIRASDKTPNDRLDTSLLAELAAGRVDVLLTEDRGIHRKAQLLGLAQEVFTIDSFLEKVTAENPALADYRVLSVRKSHVGDLDVTADFFDSFRRDYPDFDRWFNRKADETAYICTSDDGDVVAFLYLKREGKSEDYSDITPPLAPANRLKIGTLKVVFNGFKIGERFLKITFDNALRFAVDEIYVTIYRRTAEQDSLYRLLEDWGFTRHGIKASQTGGEDVLVRNFRPCVDSYDPRVNYPFISAGASKFIVPIYPAYHTELLPDSILKTEDPQHFIDNKPNRNAISKVYISRSIERDLRTGDIIVFYRTKSATGPAQYTSVATTLGVVQDVITDIPGADRFIQLCRKRSVFTDQELLRYWNYSPANRPFIVNFLYIYSLPVRPTLKQLRESHIIAEAPRGFERLTDEAFLKLMEISSADKRLVVG